MSAKIDDHEKKNMLQVEISEDRKLSVAQSASQNVSLNTDDPKHLADISDEDGQEDANSSSGIDEEDECSRNSDVVLRVGIFCAMVSQFRNYTRLFRHVAEFPFQYIASATANSCLLSGFRC
jgi:hypothetical protein